MAMSLTGALAKLVTDILDAAALRLAIFVLSWPKFSDQTM